jgi:hypothetical protein
MQEIRISRLTVTWIIKRILSWAACLGFKIKSIVVMLTGMRASGRSSRLVNHDEQSVIRG